MKKRYEVVVVGLGAVGSAVLARVAAAGQSVLGLDQYSVPNELGASGGTTKIFRIGSREGPQYVPLAQRAEVLWREIMQRSSKQLFVECGTIELGSPTEGAIVQSISSCDRYSIPYELFNSTELRARFPGYDLPEHLIGVYQPGGGLLVPGMCVASQIAAARALGAEILENTSATGWDRHSSSCIEVRTSRGAFECERLVLCAGAWQSSLIGDLSRSIKLERQVEAWLMPTQQILFSADRFPPFNLFVDGAHFSGGPVPHSPVLKFTRVHHQGQTVLPEQPSMGCCDEDEVVIRDFVSLYFPKANGRLERMKECLFDITNDGDFIVGPLPEDADIYLVAGLCGHGFRLSPVLGEIVADYLQGKQPRFDLRSFDPNRFLGAHR